MPAAADHAGGTIAGIFQKWGIGAELIFEDGRARVKMGRAQRAVVALKRSFQTAGTAAMGFSSNIAQLGMVFAPIAAGMGFLGYRASKLAGDLEAQQLTMRLLIGDAAKADELLSMIRQNAAETPFQEGDLIEGSKRLLRLTGDNIDANMDLLKTVETMAAINPTKSVVDGVEAILDATSGGGFERLKEFGIVMRADQFDMKAGEAGFEDAIIASLRETLAGQTGGADIVGELAKTFTGRTSTLQDAFDNTLKRVGKSINETLGPAIDWLTIKINDSAEDIEAGFNSMLTTLVGLWERYGQPVITAMADGWEAMGSGGRQALAGLVLGLLAVITIGTPVAGALGAVLFVVATLVSAVGSLLPLLAPSVLLPIAGVFLAVAGAAALLGGALFGMFGEEGEGPLAFLQRMAGTALEFGRMIWGELLPALQAFGAAFWGVLGPELAGLWEDLREPLQELGADLLGLFALFNGPESSTVLLWAAELGKAMAGTLVDGLKKLVGFGRHLVAVFQMMVDNLQPLVLFLEFLRSQIVGIATEGLTLRGVLDLLIHGVAKGLILMFGSVAMALVSTVEMILRAVATAVSGLPGMGAVGLALTSEAERLSGWRGTISESMQEAMGRQELEEAARQREREEADRQLQVDITDQREQTVVVESKVMVGEEELGRSQGAASVRDGERGIGPAPEPQQRGKVLRRGLTIERLSATEAG